MRVVLPSETRIKERIKFTYMPMSEEPDYVNGGFVYTFSEDAELMPQDVKTAAQAALDSMTAEAGTIDFSSVVLK